MPTDSEMPEKIYLTDDKGYKHEIACGEPLQDISFKYSDRLLREAQEFIDEVIESRENLEATTKKLAEAIINLFSILDTEEIRRILTNNYAKMHGMPMRRKSCEERKHRHGSTR